MFGVWARLRRRASQGAGLINPPPLLPPAAAEPRLRIYDLAAGSGAEVQAGTRVKVCARGGGGGGGGTTAGLDGAAALLLLETNHPPPAALVPLAHGCLRASQRPIFDAPLPTHTLSRLPVFRSTLMSSTGG